MSYVTPQRPEAEQSKYRALGKLKDYATRARNDLGATAEGSVKVVWKPRFSVVLEDEDLDLITIKEGGGLIFASEELVVKHFGKSSKEIRKAVCGSLL